MVGDGMGRMMTPRNQRARRPKKNLGFNDPVYVTVTVDALTLGSIDSLASSSNTTRTEVLRRMISYYLQGRMELSAQDRVRHALKAQQDAVEELLRQ
jgi:hypothetical protein